MYAKLFVQIFDSSIADDYQLRHFFTDLIILADSDGVVNMTPSSIAARTRMPIDMVNTFLMRLQQPDPQSQTTEAEGRRIELLEPESRNWGWHIINYRKYRDIATDEQRRLKTRQRVAKFKLKRNNLVQGSESGNAVVTQGNALVTPPYASVYASSSEGDGDERGKGGFPEVSQIFHPDSRIVLAWLNEKAGVHFREIDVNLGPISERLAEEGVTLEGIKMMLERQILCWQGTNMGDFLRPATLFSKSKFDGYYAIRLQPIHFNNKPTPKPQDSIVMQDLKRAARQAMQ